MIDIKHGDCLDVMRGMEENRIDFIVTDPPYGLHFMGKGWDKFKFKKSNKNETGGRPGDLTNNKISDSDGSFKAGTYDENRNDEFQEFMRLFGIEALRVLKPGGMLAMFGAPRRHHRQMSGLEDAGFEIRDVIAWMFGQGFPKSLDISKAIDKAKGCEREVIGIDKDFQRRNPNGKWGIAAEGYGGVKKITKEKHELSKTFSGYGTALKPAYEPIIICMKPLDGTFAQNAEKWGIAGINVDTSRIEGNKPDTIRGAGGQNGRYGPINAQGKIIDDGKGRWPSNLILSEESAEELDQMTGVSQSSRVDNSTATKTCGFHDSLGRERKPRTDVGGYKDSGGASRFFYCAKASSSERNRGLEGLPLKNKGEIDGSNCDNTLKGPGNSLHPDKNSKMQNFHPTVKPIALMKYILKLLAPPGNPICLDPFAGSGSTLVAAKELGISCIGIEKEEEYINIAKARVENAEFKPEQMEISI